MTGEGMLSAAAQWLPFLAELAAKATLVLLLAALGAALLWRASAAVRHLVWSVGVVGVLALPFFSLLLPAWELPLLPARHAAAPPAAPAPAVLPALELAPAAPSAVIPGGDAAAAPATAAAWLPRAAAALAGAGVLAGLLWLAVGFWGVARLGRRAEVVRDPEWLRALNDAAELLGLRRPVLLLRARDAAMPATGGILWPVVVVPATADDWCAERRHAVLAHELAHVKRFDCLTQALAHAACALFWWHPAVWYAARRLRVERERACDDLVLRAGTRASDYAAHLLEIARAHRGMRLAAPALVSMARPSQLESRLLWVLDAARARTAPSLRATLLAVTAGLLVVGSLSAMRPTEAGAAGGPSSTPPALEALEALDGAAAGPDGAGEDRGAISAAAAHAGAPASADVPAGGEGTANANAYANANANANTQTQAPPAFLNAGSDTIPTVEELVAMRAVGVDAAYVAELRDAGYAGLPPRQLIALRANRVTGRWVREMNGAGMGRLTPEQLTALRANGVTPAYVEELRSRGIDGLSADRVAGLRAVGVDGAYIDGMAGAGFRGIPAHQLTGMRAVGVTPGYVREMAEAGVTGLSATTVTGMRAVGVTPAYVREMAAAGASELTATMLTGMRAVGVDAAYVRSLADVGLTGLSAERLTDLRAHGVTAAYVREMRAAGIDVRTADELVRLRTSGVDRELMERKRGTPR